MSGDLLSWRCVLPGMLAPNLARTETLIGAYELHLLSISLDAVCRVGSPARYVLFMRAILCILRGVGV